MKGRVSSPRIAELPEHVRNQIAAGEVVERPASVVKELVENALDAGASEIRVELEEGGTKRIRVVDDGAGMGPEDLALAFRPHATSKLREVDDLVHVASLGFRGEALASIGSVARARILSRTAEAAHAFEVGDEGGRVSEVREAAGPHGTAVEVRDLFYNVPARRRFLKRPSTELARCLDALQRLALAQTDVGFVVLHDGRRTFDVEASMDLRARVRRVFGSELADGLVPVEGSDGGARIEGWVAPPRFARRDASRQMWFLNGRPLRDRLLAGVLRQAYRGFLDGPRQPVAFLALHLDPSAVDVNVHPTKAEVRFREERRVFGFLLGPLRAAVAGTDMATPGETLLRSAERRAGAGRPPTQPALPDPGVLAPLPRRPRGEPFSVHERPGPVVEPAPRPAAVPGGEVPGEGDPWARGDDPRGPFLQVARTYLIRALADGFEVVDQHALHERVTYEDLRRQLGEGRVEVQKSLVPELVELSRAEVALLGERAEELAGIGLDLAVFGPTTIAVHGLPALLRRPDAEAIVRDVLELLQREGRAPEGEALIEGVLHSQACRSSVMAGDELSASEIESLLARAAALESDQTCPHGRPTRVRFTLADLEKAFHRR